ncbi:MAG TPA: acyl-CoA dehydrogenase family protein, partial [Novosphingobium sp.]|nr:acyl-CoA dehydrogenase family protein [Novosphingobium sp.]
GGRHLLAPGLLAPALAARFGPEDLRAGFQAGPDRAAFVIGGGTGQSHALELEGAAILVGIEAQALSFHRPEAFVGQPVEPLDEALPTCRGALSGPMLASADDGGMAALLVAALLAGTAAAAADLAIAHATTREQFGQPIGAFQAVKHRCADMGVAAFAAEAQVALAAAAIDDGVEEAPLELAAAMVQAADAALANGRGAIQVHGGMGFTDECHAHRFFKRAHMLRQLLGPRLGQAGRLLAGG